MLEMLEGLDVPKIIIIVAIMVLIQWAMVYTKKLPEKRVKRQIAKLANNTAEMTPAQFQKMRSTRSGNKYHSNNHKFAGIYILHNKTKNLYYVGQGKNVVDRVNNHFTGRGNGDVYADHKYGDKWTIKMMALEQSEFATLNDLERHAITTYNSYHKGYNKTRGNK